MFSGIVEALGIVQRIEKEGTNLHFTLSAPFVPELKIDQSIAHNGVCLTIVDLQPNTYTVTAIKETLDKSNLGRWTPGEKVNLERSMRLDARLDGHIVQGHVDQTALCTAIKQEQGSWYFSFQYTPTAEHITVEKGSITINGVSLTVVNSIKGGFDVAIIPYTYTHTNFHTFQVGTQVNLEFDIIGKYIARLTQGYLQ